MKWAAIFGTMVLTATFARADDFDHMTKICEVAPDPSYCEVQKQQFKDEWPLANRGDYSAQRNVAFCLEHGCDGAVVIDPAAACAWRLVIMASDAPVTSSDSMALRGACDHLSSNSKANARGFARDLFLRIYGRALRD